MDWLESKINEFSEKYVRDGYQVEQHPKYTTHEPGNCADLNHLVHVRATRGIERKLLYFANLDDARILKTTTDLFKGAIGKIARRPQSQLTSEERTVEAVARLPDTPENYSYKHLATGQRVFVPEKMIALYWREARIDATHKELRVIEAMLPLAAEMDKTEWLTQRGERERLKMGRSAQRMSKKERQQFLQQAAKEANRFLGEYRCTLQLHTYNGLPEAMQAGFELMLRRPRTPFALYWNDVSINKTNKSVNQIA